MQDTASSLVRDWVTGLRKGKINLCVLCDFAEVRPVPNAVCRYPVADRLDVVRTPRYGDIREVILGQLLTPTPIFDTSTLRRPSSP